MIDTLARGLGAALLALAFAMPAYAQAPRVKPPGCVLDKCLDGAQAPDVSQPATPQSAPAFAPRQQSPSRDAGGTAPGNFDFYVFTLSWSSGFCETSGGGRGKSQCDAGSGLGFVVHGLWPQYERGFPSDCGADRAPSRIALEATRGVFPDEGLARYEWRKHGTCSGKSPEAYFGDVKSLFRAIAIPDRFKSPRQEQTVAPNDIARAFIASNPGLRIDAMAIGCQRRVLQEVRLCLTKDLRQFRSCPEVARGTCRSTDVSIPPVL